MSHRIYFAQHGLAVDKADDPERPLSPTGRQQTENIAKTLRDSNLSVSEVFHSGKLRALQTAKIFADALHIPSISAIEGLSPNDNSTLLAKNLNINHALYIGHLPHLEKLTAYLLTGKESANIIKFQNSGVLCLKKINDQYQLCWYLSPNLLMDNK